jgi:uncharacterized protein (DUF849 family)
MKAHSGDEPIILTCAGMGVSTVNKRNPCFPLTPLEIADACIEAALAGASIVHIYARDSQSGKVSYDPSVSENRRPGPCCWNRCQQT